MTITTTTSTRSFSGDASTTVFAYNYKILDDDEIQVIIRAATGAETVKEKGTHYTVSGVGVPSGGNITFGTAPANTETVVLRRSTPQTQSVDLVENDPFTAETVEGAFDRSVILAQELQEQVDRSIKISRTNTMTSTEFTNNATSRANKILSFDASGELSIAQELGTFKGNSATITTAAFNVRDIVKGTTTEQLNNIYICVGASAIGDVLTDTDHWALIVDAVSAAASATTATTKASEASASASAAASSETAAETAETNAETAEAAAVVAQNAAVTAQNAAVAALDSFDDVYLGSKSSAPSVDNDGDALATGALYFNSSNNTLFYWTGSAWNSATPTTLNSLTDTNLTSPADGAMLLYDTGTSKWIDNVMSGDATMADTGVITIANDAVTADKIADSINSAITANTAKVTNATHTGEVTGATALTIADNVVDEANLKVSNAPTNGYFLSAQSGDTGGLTWAEAAGGFSFNAVTGATPSLNVGSYNFFDNGTLTADTTVSFASVPTEARWTYSFAGGITSSFNIAAATATGNTKSIAAQDTAGSGIAFKTNGLEMYIVGQTADDVFQYTLTTAWDISTATYTQNYALTSPTITVPYGIEFKPDGLSMYIISQSNDTIYQYTLSTAWDISTASSASKSFASTTQDGTPIAMTFKADGTAIYILGNDNDTIYQYTLSTAWDLSTATYASKSFLFSTQDSQGRAMYFNGDGTKFFLMGGTTYNIFSYSLSIAYDISTCTVDAGVIFSVGAAKTTQCVSPDGVYLYAFSTADDIVTEYTIGTLTTLTLPAAVTGTPSAVTTGNHYLEFFTKDSGTTVDILSETIIA